MTTSIPADGGPLVLADVVRELHAIADAAARAGDPDVIAACRRAESLLARLRDQFVFEVAGNGTPSGITSIDAA
jgi:hypothetical protein